MHLSRARVVAHLTRAAQVVSAVIAAAGLYHAYLFGADYGWLIASTPLLLAQGAGAVGCCLLLVALATAGLPLLVKRAAVASGLAPVSWSVAVTAAVGIYALSSHAFVVINVAHMTRPAELRHSDATPVRPGEATVRVFEPPKTAASGGRSGLLLVVGGFASQSPVLGVPRPSGAFAKVAAQYRRVVTVDIPGGVFQPFTPFSRTKRDFQHALRGTGDPGAFGALTPQLSDRRPGERLTVIAHSKGSHLTQDIAEWADPNLTSVAVCPPFGVAWPLAQFPSAEIQEAHAEGERLGREIVNRTAAVGLPWAPWDYSYQLENDHVVYVSPPLAEQGPHHVLRPGRGHIEALANTESDAWRWILELHRGATPPAAPRAEMQAE